MAIFNWKGEDWLVSKRWPQGALRAPMRVVVDAILDAFAYHGTQVNRALIWKDILHTLAISPSITPPASDISFRSDMPPKRIIIEIHRIRRTIYPSKSDTLATLIRRVATVFESTTIETFQDFEPQILEDLKTKITLRREVIETSLFRIELELK